MKAVGLFWENEVEGALDMPRQLLSNIFEEDQDRRIRIMFRFHWTPLLLLPLLACQGSHGEEESVPEQEKEELQKTPEKSSGTKEAPEDGVLSQKAIEERFPQESREELDIRFPIVRAHRYSDREGTHLFVMTERIAQTGAEVKEKVGFLDDVTKVAGDTLKDSIRGHHFSIRDGKLKKEWDLLDFILEDNGVCEEFSISFWPRYCSFTDMDEDGRVDPLIVYRTLGLNGISDGRVKALLYYKGKKYAVRFRNGTLDGQSRTRIDRDFAQLPEKVLEQVEQRLQRMREQEMEAWNLEIDTKLPRKGQE